MNLVTTNRKHIYIHLLWVDCKLTDDSNGHNKKAQKLKEEIDEYIEYLKENVTPPDSEDQKDGDKDDKDKKDQDQDEEKTKREELKELIKGAL